MLRVVLQVAQTFCKKAVNSHLLPRLRGINNGALCSYSVAMAVVHWWPCCWLEEEAGPAVAMAAGGQRGAVVAGCWGEEEVVASCPWEEATDLQGKNQSVTPQIILAEYLKDLQGKNQSTTPQIILIEH